MVVIGMAAAVTMVTGFGWWAKKNLMSGGEGEEAEGAAAGGGAAGAGAGGAEGERLASAKKPRGNISLQQALLFHTPVLTVTADGLGAIVA